MSHAEQVRLANDVAAQFGHLPPDEAAAAVADHLRRFWSPAMRAQLVEAAAGGAAGAALAPTARAAAALLAP